MQRWFVSVGVVGVLAGCPGDDSGEEETDGATSTGMTMSASGSASGTMTSASATTVETDSATGTTDGSATGTTDGSATGTSEATGTGTSVGTGSSGETGVGMCGVDDEPPSANACPQECDNCSNSNTVCVIECGGSECSDGTVDCPPDMACEITCDGVDACDTSTINCPDEFACSVTCTGGVDACGDIELQCGAGTCAIECDPDACTGAQVNCGAEACTATCNGDHAPMVDCGASCECTECM